MDEYINVVKKSLLFSEIEAADVNEMLKCLDAEKRNYKKGEYILNVGDSTDSLGMVLSGSVIVYNDDLWGNRNLISHVLPSQLFGEAFASSPGGNVNLSVVSEIASMVLWISVKKLLSTCPSVCERHTQIIRNLLTDLAQKTLKFNEKIIHMGQRTTKDKLLSYLSSEAHRNNSIEFDIPFNRQQLADYLSVERSAMSKQLCEMRNEGLLGFNKNHFILHI